jgi:hypothetical protein
VITTTQPTRNLMSDLVGSQDLGEASRKKVICVCLSCYFFIFDFFTIITIFEIVSFCR